MKLNPHFAKVFFVLCVVLLSTTNSTAQLNFNFQEGTFMLKGKVVDIHTKRSIPLTNIKIHNGAKHKTFTCDNDGNFVIYVSKTDSLKFSSVGFIARTLLVSNIDSADFYTLQVELIHDFVKVKEIIIYPYRDVDEFKEAFVNAKNQNKVVIPGIDAPKYSNEVPKAKFTNPISFLYERTKRKRVANPDFKP